LFLVQIIAYLGCVWKIIRVEKHSKTKPDKSTSDDDCWR